MPDNSHSENPDVSQPKLGPILRFFGGIMVGFLASVVAMSAAGVVLIILMQISSGSGLRINAEAIGWSIFLGMVVVIVVGFVKIMGSFQNAGAMICGMAVGILTISNFLNEMVF